MEYAEFIFLSGCRRHFWEMLFLKLLLFSWLYVGPFWAGKMG